MFQLSIIIINYKSSQLVCDCIESIYAQKSSFNFEIIVVDNDSKDGSQEKILCLFPEIIWIEMNYNSGFARANNEGIKKSNANVVLLLNGDTIIENNAIEKCFNHFQFSEYVACGVQLLNPDRSPQISGNYAMKGGLNYLLPLPFLGNLLKSFANILGVKKPNVPDASGIIEVDWINGAFLMVKKPAIQKAGLMDEDFFLYAEEAEWCSRLKKVGKLCIYGDINVIHLQGETSNETFGSSGKGYMNLFDRKGLQIMLSNLVRIRKEFGVGNFIFILSVYTFEIPIFFIGVLISKIFFSNKYSFTTAKNYASNVFKIIKLSPTIINSKPHFYKVL
ncbi:MAG: glycosyltransferase family 2 protein [Ginsengibacter sp.]